MFGLDSLQLVWVFLLFREIFFLLKRKELVEVPKNFQNLGFCFERTENASFSVLLDNFLGPVSP